MVDIVVDHAGYLRLKRVELHLSRDPDGGAAKAALVGERARWQLGTEVLGALVAGADASPPVRAFLEEQLRLHESARPPLDPELESQLDRIVDTYGARGENYGSDVGPLLQQADLAWNTAAGYPAADEELRRPWTLLAGHALRLADTFVSERLGIETPDGEGWRRGRRGLVADFKTRVEGLKVTLPPREADGPARSAPMVARWFRTLEPGRKGQLRNAHALVAQNLQLAVKADNSPRAADGSRQVPVPMGVDVSRGWLTGIKDARRSRQLENLLDGMAAAGYYGERARRAEARGDAEEAHVNTRNATLATAAVLLGFEEQGLDPLVQQSRPGSTRQRSLQRTRAGLGTGSVTIDPTFTPADLREGRALIERAPAYEGRREVSPELVRLQELWLLATVNAASFADSRRSEYEGPWLRLAEMTLVLLADEASSEVTSGRNGPWQPAQDVVAAALAQADEQRRAVTDYLDEVTEGQSLAVAVPPAGTAVKLLPETAFEGVFARAGTAEAHALSGMLSTTYPEIAGPGTTGTAGAFARQAGSLSPLQTPPRGQEHRAETEARRPHGRGAPKEGNGPRRDGLQRDVRPK